MLPHTVIVDFGVALLLTSAACEVLAAIAEDDEFRIVALWTLVFGTAASVLAAISGFAAYNDAAPVGAADTVVIWHRNAGIAMLACFLPAAVWRLVLRGEYPQRLTAVYWTIVVIGTAAVAVTAYLGGTAVFRHGVGVLDG